MLHTDCFFLHFRRHCISSIVDCRNEAVFFLQLRIVQFALFIIMHVNMFNDLNLSYSTTVILSKLVVSYSYEGMYYYSIVCDLQMYIDSNWPCNNSNWPYYLQGVEIIREECRHEESYLMSRTQWSQGADIKLCIIPLHATPGLQSTKASPNEVTVFTRNFEAVVLREKRVFRVSITTTMTLEGGNRDTTHKIDHIKKATHQIDSSSSQFFRVHSFRYNEMVASWSSNGIVTERRSVLRLLMRYHRRDRHAYCYRKR